VSNTLAYFAFDEVEKGFLLLASDLIHCCCFADDSDASDVANSNDGVTLDDKSVVLLRENMSRLLLNCDSRTARKVRLKLRQEIPKNYRERIFLEVPSAEAEDLPNVSFSDKLDQR
jgi:hypothetical protein